MSATAPARKERDGGRTAMFVRLLLRATLVRRGRALTALLAVIVAAAATAAMMTLYADVQSKLRAEFRSYGANIVVTAKQGEALPPDVLMKVDAALVGRGVAAPFAYAVARAVDGSPLVVAGTDFARVRKLDAFWSVTQWPNSAGEALVGERAARVLAPNGGSFDLDFQGKKLHVQAFGILKTGGDEDSRVYLPLDAFVTWTGVSPATIEIGATGSQDEIRQTMSRIALALPSSDVQAVRQIVEGEARVLGKTRSTLLAAILVIIATAALCMLATLTAWVMERRKDFAVMKALGASNRLVSGFFAVEASAIGAVGAVVGYGVGLGIAAWIARVNFRSTVTPRLSVLPVVFIGSIGVALLSSALPLSILRRVQPAAILRGE